MRNAGTYARALLAPLVSAVAWFYYPYCGRGPVLCVWRRLFHVHCPGCGLTRAMCLLAHGHYADAIAMNWRVLPAIAILLGVSWHATSGILGGARRSLPTPVRAAEQGEKRWLKWGQQN
jgi:hypothetical protein